LIWRGDFLYGLNAVLLAGILLSHHYIAGDGALFLPVALTLVQHPIARYSKIPAIYLASPLAYATFGSMQAIVILALLFVSAYELWKYRQLKKEVVLPA
jgi:hypothetical protein